jgi:hypothetical protein
MSRYIDADKVMEEIDRIGGHNLCEWETIGVKALIDRQPTADVVPKSEVDRAYERGFERGKKDNVCGFSAEEIAQKAENIAIELEAMRTAANSYKMHYENARAEVAREIFEEIEKELNFFKNYRLYIEDVQCMFGVLAELKKKYTEGEK